MILKKPYAFFIKNFKLFHLIIFVLSSILLYRTSLIYSFIKEYINTNPNLIGKELTDVLFVNWVYILVVLITIINIVIIIIMIRKQKPLMYYILNISLYIGVIIVYILSHKVVGSLEVMLVETKTILAIRDITNIARLLQTVSIIFYLVRATGFDIKKFDFVRDLQSLDISEEDSEEYELAVEFEKNVFIRNYKRKLRNAKYYYKENKFIINIILLFVFGISLLLIYTSINKYNKVYKENDYFQTGSINIGITNSYIVENDYKNESINDKESIVVLKMSLNSFAQQKVYANKLVLSINNKNYYHTNEYSNLLVDLGTTYSEQNASKEFKNYILIYKIPKEEINAKMTFKYIDNIEYKKGKTIVNSLDVELKPIKIDELDTKEKVYNLKEEIDTTSNISSYKIKINDYEIKPIYKTTYNACIKENECYDFVEILSPLVERNNQKVILKINGSIEYKETLNSIVDIYGFINTFGSIEYTYNGTKYIEKNDFNQLKFKKIKDDNYYIEVDKNIIEASDIKLVFNIRNNKYTYILKGDANV